MARRPGVAVALCCCCAVSLAILSGAVRATVIVNEPPLKADFYFDNSGRLKPGYVVRWTTDQPQYLLVTIELWDRDAGGILGLTDAKLGTLTSGGGTSNAKEDGQTYAEFITGASQLDISKLRRNRDCYLYFVIGSDKKEHNIDLYPDDPCDWTLFNPCNRTTTNCRREGEGRSTCDCKPGFHVVQGSCHSCATREPCPMFSTCSPTDVLCYCDSGYQLSRDRSGCEYCGTNCPTRSPTPYPTPPPQPYPAPAPAPAPYYWDDPYEPLATPTGAETPSAETPSGGTRRPTPAPAPIPRRSAAEAPCPAGTPPSMCMHFCANCDGATSCTQSQQDCSALVCDGRCHMWHKRPCSVGTVEEYDDETSYKCVVAADNNSWDLRTYVGRTHTPCSSDAHVEGPFACGECNDGAMALCPIVGGTTANFTQSTPGAAPALLAPSATVIAIGAAGGALLLACCCCAIGVALYCALHKKKRVAPNERANGGGGGGGGGGGSGGAGAMIPMGPVGPAARKPNAAHTAVEASPSSRRSRTSRRGGTSFGARKSSRNTLFHSNSRHGSRRQSLNLNDIATAAGASPYAAMWQVQAYGGGGLTAAPPIGRAGAYGAY